MQKKYFLLSVIFLAGWAVWALSSAPKAAADTAADTVAPTVPGTLYLMDKGATFAKLQWIASSDSFDPLGVTYIIYKDGTAAANASTVDYTLTGLLPNTTYKLTVAAKDTANNTSAQGNAVTVTTPSDTIPPTVAITLPADKAVLNGISYFNATSTDDVAVARVQYQVDGSNYGDAQTASPYTQAFNAESFTKGSSHTLRALAFDAAGNAGIPPTLTFTCGNPVAPAPYSAVVTNITYNSATVTWNTGFGTTGAVVYGLDTSYGKRVQETGSPSAHSVNLAGLDSGKDYHFYLESILSGFATATSTDMTFSTPAPYTEGDKAPPTVAVVAPQQGAAINGTATITVSATESYAPNQTFSGLASVYLNIDGKAFGSSLYSAPFNFLWDTTKFSNGSHNVTAYASDNAGNVGTSTTATFLVANSSTGSPTLPSASPSGAHPNGTLVLDGSTVYLIKDGARAGFRDPEEYKSYGYNFGQLAPINDADKQLPASSSVLKAMPGALVLDKADNKTVYMIGESGSKRGFTTPAVFYGLGYNFKNLFKINLADYPSGPAINSATAAHPEGALVKDSQGAIWWVLSGQKRGFGSMDIFNSYGFSSARIVKANSADAALSAGAAIKFRDGSLIKQGSDYYIISDGKKLKFASSDKATQLGYKLTNALAASVDGYESGGEVQ